MTEVDAIDASSETADEAWMQLALDLALQGQGYVEPNPMVGCVIVKHHRKIGAGFHQEFGGDHAEISALKNCQVDPRGSTVYVTLEPCCHQGKTPPCTKALIEAGVSRVVVALGDPNPAVDGRGVSQLRSAGIEVTEGVLQAKAIQLNAPYRKRIVTGKPWIIAKWAMTLDGKIATTTGNSKWISGEKSRQIVHQLRGRVDAILVGSGTVQADNPMLTARSAGKRIATRVVMDSRLTTNLSSQLVSTAAQFPTVLATSDAVEQRLVDQLESAGCEVIRLAARQPQERLDDLLCLLGQRNVTNVLVEGGGVLLGSLLDLRQIDEVHVFIAPKLIGGHQAITPIAGQGIALIKDALRLESPQVQILDNDIYLEGHIQR